MNTRDTRVELIFDLVQSSALTPSQQERALQNLGGRLDSDGKLRIVASEGRTQGRNRDLAVTRLHEVLGDALRPPPAVRRSTRPSAAARHRRIARKRARGELKKLRSSVPEE